jgi:hypothetical protein
MKTNWIEHVLKLHEQNYGTHHTALAREELAEIERQAVADAGEAFELCEENHDLRREIERLMVALKKIAEHSAAFDQIIEIAAAALAATATTEKERK